MYISVDLGGTTTRVASSKDLPKIKDIETFSTKQNLSEQKKLLKESIQNLVGDEDVKYICLGVPGLIDRKNRVYENIVNYPHLNGEKFEFLFDLPEDFPNLLVENDANLAGLGEAINGEAKNYESVVYLTLSTGVGGVKIINKRLDPFQSEFEPGHMIIVEDGVHDDICGQKGCLHAYLSGEMFKKVYGEDVETTKNQEIWTEYGKHLATGIINVIAMWDPEIIVIGGSIVNSYDLFSPKMFEILEDQDLFKLPEIVKSNLDGKNGLIGGFEYIRQNLK